MTDILVSGSMSSKLNDKFFKKLVQKKGLFQSITIRMESIIELEIVEIGNHVEVK